MFEPLVAARLGREGHHFNRIKVGCPNIGELRLSIKRFSNVLKNHESEVDKIYARSFIHVIYLGEPK